jgi:hypothetical protein
MQRILFVLLAAVSAFVLPASAQQQAQRAPLIGSGLTNSVAPRSPKMAATSP